jgi:hypothetical protein
LGWSVAALNQRAGHFATKERTNREMIYKHLEDGTHQLSITGPELADIATLVATLSKVGDEAAKVSDKLFHFLRFQKLYEEFRVAGPKESCFQKVYKHSPDGMFRLIFTDVEYYTMVDLLMSFNDTDDDTVSVIRELFNAFRLSRSF